MATRSCRYTKTGSCRYWSLDIRNEVFIVLAIAIVATTVSSVTRAEPTLHGTVLDGETNSPIPFVTVILDSATQQLTTKDGTFNFGPVARGNHVLVFEHISYERRSISVRWPTEKIPLRVKLQSTQFVTDKILVTGKRTLQSIPVSSIAISREEITAAPGNIANDPLRTVQFQPSCAIDGIDFLSKMAVRGGDTEEHRAYFDGYPLSHYTHVGGFAGVVYDDMLESTVLVPGAVPIRYRGSLSGIVLLKPARPDSSFLSFRYDITSMAGGGSHAVNPSLTLQAAAKTDFFNLPVYQQVGVEERSFKDVMGRVIASPHESIAITTTILLTEDSETGTQLGVVQPKREVRSMLAGIDLSYRSRGWLTKLRPSFSYFESRDALTWGQQVRAHELRESSLFAEVSKRSSVFRLSLFGEAGVIRHEGHGGSQQDNQYSASAEFSVLVMDIAALVLGAGGSREPWTSTFEPEAYGSARIYVGDLASVSGGFRRSHQTPFIFTERRYFASFPIDAGDLLASYTPSWNSASAVQMDQVSVGATVELPLQCSLEFNGFQREYRDLLTWDWQNFPDVSNVNGGGEGHGYGYEIKLVKNHPNRLYLMAAAARARIWKTEGSLVEEKIGDFDRPDSYQVGFILRFSDKTRFSMRWMDVIGRPYTLYLNQSTAPTTDQVNSKRLPGFRRVDAKFTYTITDESFNAVIFLDIVNVLNRRNRAASFAMEVAPGSFGSASYGGTKFFPIAGVTIRW